MHRSFQPMLAPLTLLCLFLTGCPRSQPRVVLYCAQDREFAEESLAEFTKSTGIKVVPEFDTEADKSVSLYQNLIQEKARPRCDVFWNNEILSTIRLERQGLLEPYASPAAEPYPDRAKAKDHTWHAFANRARVLIVNTQKVPANERPRSLLDLTNERWQGRAVMARPMHGTSATQAACLFEVLGQEKAQEYYRALLANKMEIAPGNKQVAEWVGQGRTPRGSPVVVGVTDTDDALDEVNKGSPVAIIFPDGEKNEKFPRMGTLFIPNTLCVIRGGPNNEVPASWSITCSARKWKPGWPSRKVIRYRSIPT